MNLEPVEHFARSCGPSDTVSVVLADLDSCFEPVIRLVSAIRKKFEGRFGESVKFVVLIFRRKGSTESLRLQRITGIDPPTTTAMTTASPAVSSTAGAAVSSLTTTAVSSTAATAVSSTAATVISAGTLPKEVNWPTSQAFRTFVIPSASSRANGSDFMACYAIGRFSAFLPGSARLVVFALTADLALGESLKTFTGGYWSHPELTDLAAYGTACGGAGYLIDPVSFGKKASPVCRSRSGATGASGRRPPNARAPDFSPVTNFSSFTFPEVGRIIPSEGSDYIEADMPNVYAMLEYVVENRKEVLESEEGLRWAYGHLWPHSNREFTTRAGAIPTNFAKWLSGKRGGITCIAARATAQMVEELIEKYLSERIAKQTPQ